MEDKPLPVFHMPTDRSGFYIYIKDGEEYWCPSNEPCKTRPEYWQSAHGMGYTRFGLNETE
jgi:cellobiose phosphorylase